MKRFISILLCIAIACSMSTGVYAAVESSTTADYILKTVPSPTVSAVGGEWAVLGLARGNTEVPSGYFENYYQTVENYVKERDGVLHSKKYTEYSRVVIALTAIGNDPTNVAGYDLTAPLTDFDKTVRQGINGAIFALMALDGGDYESGAREKYVEHILSCQLSDGGWSLTGTSFDSDVTAMALQALAKYTDRADVNSAVQNALALMSKEQTASGGYKTGGVETAESIAQMIVALCELGIPLDDSRFVKNGNTLLDALDAFKLSNGSFKHLKSRTSPDQMATEQCLYALAAAERAAEGKSSLYRMSDAKNTVGELPLDSKHPDVQKKDIIFEKNFTDIANHKNKTAVEALAKRGIISGKTDTLFCPDATMTRAEFATIIVNGLGLPQKSGAEFCDVAKSDWYFGYANTAYAYGIIKGVSDKEFAPNGTLTREEAAVMVARAAKLCGCDTEYTSFDARNSLAAFSDYVKASEWAYVSLAFCYDNGILDSSVMAIDPKETVTRAEVAQMLYNVLELAKLL